MTISEKPEDTLHAIASRASELASQVAALQKHAGFTDPADQQEVATSREALLVAGQALRAVEDRLRAAGEWES